MEAVSAVKMRKSQERALQGRPYAQAALRILRRVNESTSARHHELLKKNSGTHECIIVITSDKGLAGSLNTAVLKEATNLVSSLSKDTVELICFGKKSYEYFLRRDYTIPKHFLTVSDAVGLPDIDDVTNFIVTSFANDTYHTVRIVYQNFVSTFEQSAVVRNVLPLNTDALEIMVKDIIPKHGRYSESEARKKTPSYVLEPSNEAIFDSLFPILIKIMIYHALLESKASEHSARMVAMKNATDKAKEVTHTLTLQYNKARQAVITREVSEITGGIEAMKSST
jgi:F-type H+-transporting ATPase subunit gamma